MSGKVQLLVPESKFDATRVVFGAITTNMLGKLQVKKLMLLYRDPIDNVAKSFAVRCEFKRSCFGIMQTYSYEDSKSAKDMSAADKLKAQTGYQFPFMMYAKLDGLSEEDKKKRTNFSDQMDIVRRNLAQHLFQGCKDFAKSDDPQIKQKAKELGFDVLSTNAKTFFDSWNRYNDIELVINEVKPFASPIDMSKRTEKDKKVSNPEIPRTFVKLFCYKRDKEKDLKGVNVLYAGRLTAPGNKSLVGDAAIAYCLEKPGEIIPLIAMPSCFIGGHGETPYRISFQAHCVEFAYTQTGGGMISAKPIMSNADNEDDDEDETKSEHEDENLSASLQGFSLDNEFTGSSS